MLKPSRVSFIQVWEIIQQIDVTRVIRLNSVLKKTYKDRLRELTFPLGMLLSGFMIGSTLIVTKCELINIIFCISSLMSLINLYTTMTMLRVRKDKLIYLVKWCKDLYELDKKFHQLVRNIAEPHLVRIETRTVRILKRLQLLLYSDVFCATVGFAFVGFSLPDSIYPKFSAPMPFYLPFNDQKTWVAFITTVAIQAIFGFQAVVFTIYIFGVFFCITSHVIGYLDMIVDVIDGIIKPEMLVKFKNRESFSFDTWVPILTEMICDANFAVTSVNELYTESFLLMEIASLGSLFIFGLIFNVVRQQYFFAVGILFVTCFLYIFCYINEMILDKFSCIKEALYDIPWYDLTLKERKMLMILMNCDELQIGFTAAGAHGLTVNRFGIIVKAGYTNFLVLKDLIMK